MSEQREVPPDAGDDSENPVVDGKIAVDCPCIDCKYNLRGLDETARCPECGAAIGRTLKMISARVLCPRCLAELHPSQTHCGRCGEPLQTSGLISDLAGGELHIPPGSRSTAELGPAPLAPVILIWVLFGPAALFVTMVWCVSLGAFLLDLWRVGPAETLGDIGPVTAVMSLFGTGLLLALDALLFFVTRSYIRRRNAARDEAEAEDEGEPVDEESTGADETKR